MKLIYCIVGLYCLLLSSEHNNIPLLAYKIGILIFIAYCLFNKSLGVNKIPRLIYLFIILSVIMFTQSTLILLILMGMVILFVKDDATNINLQKITFYFICYALIRYAFSFLFIYEYNITSYLSDLLINIKLGPDYFLLDLIIWITLTILFAVSRNNILIVSCFLIATYSANLVIINIILKYYKSINNLTFYYYIATLNIILSALCLFFISRYLDQRSSKLLRLDNYISPLLILMIASLILPNIYLQDYKPENKSILFLSSDKLLNDYQTVDNKYDLAKTNLYGELPKLLNLLGYKIFFSKTPIQESDISNIDIVCLTRFPILFPDGHFKIPHLWPGQNPPGDSRGIVYQ